MWPRSVKSYALIRVDDVSFPAVPCFNLFAVCTCMIFEHMAGVQNSRSQGLYAVRRVGIEKLILHFGYEEGRN